jgi:hypothetical protein
MLSTADQSHVRSPKRTCRRWAVISFRCLGNVPVAFSIGIVLVELAVFVLLIITAIYKNFFIRLILYAITAAIVFGISKSLYFTLTAPFLSLQQFLEEQPDGPGSLSGEFIYCSKCSSRAPVHSHHCSICDVCIMHHDHHCVFINRCVGAGNLDHFDGFLTACMVGTATALLFSLPMIFNWSHYTKEFSISGLLISYAALFLCIAVFSLVTIMKFVMKNQ